MSTEPSKLEKAEDLIEEALNLSGQDQAAKIIEIVQVVSHAYHDLTGKPIDVTLVPHIDRVE